MGVTVVGKSEAPGTCFVGGWGDPTVVVVWAVLVVGLQHFTVLSATSRPLTWGPALYQPVACVRVVLFFGGLRSVVSGFCEGLGGHGGF